MKIVFAAVAALIGVTGAAHAADLRPRMAPPSFAPAPAFTWTGFYIGAHAGYMWNDTDTKLSYVEGAVLTADVDNGIFPRSIGFEDKGFLGGLQVGYNMQFGSFVAGVEADASWIDSGASKLHTAIDPNPPFTGLTVNSTYRSELEWLGTVRARAGIAFDRVLVYATGGLAFGEVRNAFTVAIPAIGYAPAAWTSSDTEWGWAVGAGVEYAFADNISVRVEYLHYDLGDRTVHASDPVAFPGQFIDYDFGNSGNIVRGGVNVRF